MTDNEGYNTRSLELLLVNIGDSLSQRGGRYRDAHRPLSALCGQREREQIRELRSLRAAFIYRSARARLKMQERERKRVRESFFVSRASASIHLRFILFFYLFVLARCCCFLRASLFSILFFFFFALASSRFPFAHVSFAKRNSSSRARVSVCGEQEGIILEIFNVDFFMYDRLA